TKNLNLYKKSGIMIQIIPRTLERLPKKVAEEGMYVRGVSQRNRGGFLTKPGGVSQRNPIMIQIVLVMVQISLLMIQNIYLSIKMKSKICKFPCLYKRN